MAVRYIKHIDYNWRWMAEQLL